METRMNLVSLGEFREQKLRQTDTKARRNTQLYHLFQINLLEDWIGAVKKERLVEGDSPEIEKNLESILDISKGFSIIYSGAKKLLPLIHYELGDYYIALTDKSRHKYNMEYESGQWMRLKLKGEMYENYCKAVMHLREGVRSDPDKIRAIEANLLMSKFALRSEEVLDLSDVHEAYRYNALNKVKAELKKPTITSSKKDLLYSMLDRINQDKL